jgi:hypothetical protein
MMSSHRRKTVVSDYVGRRAAKPSLRVSLSKLPWIVEVSEAQASDVSARVASRHSGCRHAPAVGSEAIDDAKLFLLQ